MTATDDKRQIIYFGCWGRAGHFYYDIAGNSLGLSAPALGLPWEHVDGRLTPGQRDRRGRLDYEMRGNRAQGKAAIHHKGGWTALALHDFTVDDRPGSNSVFFFRTPNMDADGCLRSIQECFPKIAKRIGEIQVVVTVDDDA